MSPPQNRTNLFDKHSMMQIAHTVLLTIGLSACYVLTCGFPFGYYASLSTVDVPQVVRGAAGSTSADIERAGARSLERQIAGWKTIRVASGVIGIGVGIPAIVLYFQPWLVEKWTEIFLMISVVLSATSFSFATILISSFADWSGDVKELKSDLLAWSILFSIPNIALAWSAMSLVTAAATLAANKIVFSSAIEYFETAVAVLMFVIGLAITTLFYMVHSIWKL